MWPLWLGLPLLLLAGVAPAAHPGPWAPECDVTLTAPRGHFHSPNFPAAFRTPVACRWVIQAAPGQLIVVHLAQFYLREAVSAKEYIHYPSWHTRDVHDLGVLRPEHHDQVRSCREFLVLRMVVHDLANANLRVLPALLDVYGFNFTYQIVDAGFPGACTGDLAPLPAEIVPDACTVASCSFNGECLADAGYVAYACRCFAGFEGPRCQYGPQCDARRAINGPCAPGKLCSYTIGNTMGCACPTDFTGRNCETRIDYEFIADCRGLNCSSGCERGGKGKAVCTCKQGFHIVNDNRTCVSSGLTRYLAAIKLKNDSYIPRADAKYSVAYNRSRDYIAREISRALSLEVLQMKNLTVIEFSPGAIVVFHFFGSKNKSTDVQDAYNKAVWNRGMVGSIPVERTYNKFETEPAMNIQSLEVEVLRGELRLTCITLGSSNLTFKWFKDGAPLDSFISAGNVWHSSLPKNGKDELTYILTIGKVDMSHTGAYTCRVMDWGQIAERTRTAKVYPPPVVRVKPRSLTVSHGDKVTILCLATMFENVTFGYNWAKHGQIYNPSDSETVEDIYRTGSRVIIPEAKASATYTCVVSGKTGETKVESRITVIDPNVIKVCPQQSYLNVDWRLTAPHTNDIQPCPDLFLGDAVRRCVQLGGHPIWEEPDFSDCRSNNMNRILSKFANLKSGFVVNTPSEFLEQTLDEVNLRGSAMYPGEGAKILKFISIVHEFQVKFPSLDPFFADLGGGDIFFDIISQLLKNGRAINKEEQVLQLIQQVQRRALYIGKHLSTGNSLRIDKDSLAVDIFRKPVTNRLNFAVPIRRVKRGQLDWYTNSVLTTVHMDNAKSLIDSNSSMEIAVIFYKNLSRLLPQRASQSSENFRDIEYELNSKIVTVAYQVDGQGSPLDSVDGHIKVAFDQSSWEVERTGWNLTCGLANLSQGRLQWSLEGCSLVSIENVTSCFCTRFGTYVVLLTTYLSDGTEELLGRLDSIVAIGCFVGSVLTFLALISLAVCWRNDIHCFAILKMQVCVGILGVTTTFLTTAQIVLPICAYPYVLTLIEFFLLEPLAMHVCLELFLYLELANAHQIENAIVKITLLGWGIPTLVTGATLIAQAQNGFVFRRWWMEIGDTFFLGFTIAAIVLFGLYILLYLVVYLELKHHVTLGSPQRVTNATKRIGLLRRSMVLQFATAAMAVTSVLYGSSPTTLHSYAFSAVCGFTGFLVFLLNTIKSENPGCICSKDRSAASKDSTGSSSRTITTSSLLKTDGNRTDSTVLDSFSSHMEPVGDWKKERRLKAHGQHCILRGSEAREMEDLLHDMVGYNHCNSRNSLPSGDKGGACETYLPPREVGLKTPDARPPQCAMLTRKMSYPQRQHKARADMGIVNYEGSPKKYPSTKELGPMAYQWPLPQEVLRPERGICYIRSSPDPSSARDSPSSSCMSAEGSTSGLKIAQLGRPLQPFPFRSHTDLSAPERLSVSSAGGDSEPTNVPLGKDGLMRGYRVVPSDASDLFGRVKVHPAGADHLVPLEKRDTVV